MDVNPDLDLSPRTGGDEAPRRTGGDDGPRRWLGLAVVVVVLGIGGFAVSQALGDATLFFRNADEAVAQRSELGIERFRLQGLVGAGTVVEDPGADLVEFEVTWNGVTVPVEHRGDPPELFQDGIPVVLEGHWSDVGPDAVFLSDRMLVKHDENYEEDNAERLTEAEDGADSTYDEGSTGGDAPTGGAGGADPEGGDGGP